MKPRCWMVVLLVAVLTGGVWVAGCSDEKEQGECGDGVKGTDEECDGEDLGEATCQSLGYDSGTLRCRDDCTFSETLCYESSCGNGNIDQDEDCDASNLGGETCRSLGYDGGDLDCTDGCVFDTSGCEGNPCGNGSIDYGEECDGDNLNGQTCDTLGYDGGQLQCSDLCTFNTLECGDPCGNGSIDVGEECDEDNLNGETCRTLGYQGGVLACTQFCWYDTDGCTGDPCGNGQIDPYEECDGQNLGDGSCENLGFDGGTLDCNELCFFDTSGCLSPCGNGDIDADEECDSENLDGKTCQSLGYSGTELTCTDQCELDVSGCLCPNEDAYEPNSISQMAASVQVGLSATGLVVCTEGDEDWFQIPLNGKTRYGFSLTFAHVEGNIDAHLYAPGMLTDPVAYGVSFTDNEQLEYLVPTNAAGTYYLQVLRFIATDPAQTYGLAITNEGEVECVLDEDCGGGQACVENQCVQATPGDRCTDPIAVDTLPFAANAVDITQYAADFEFDSDGCTSFWTAGRDVFYRINLNPGQALSASVTSTFDASLYLISECAPSPAPTDDLCLVGADFAMEGETESITYTAESAMTVILGVDHYAQDGPDQGSFDLTIE